MRERNSGEFRILAIDYGEKRLGLAVSDPAGLLAQPFKVIPREEALERLAAVIKEQDIGEVVVGLPVSLSGRPSRKTEEVQEFVEELKRAFPNLTINTFDERLTTIEAERALLEADMSRASRKQVIDKVAASLMLKAYLEAKRRKVQD